MKKIKKNFSMSEASLEELRKELRARLSLEELEYSFRLEALDQVVSISQLDSATFDRLWIQPLLAEGLSREAAIRCIANSCLWPN